MYSTVESLSHFPNSKKLHVVSQIMAKSIFQSEQLAEAGAMHQLRFGAYREGRCADRHFAPHVFWWEQIITGREVSEGTDQVL